MAISGFSCAMNMCDVQSLSWQTTDRFTENGATKICVSFRFRTCAIMLTAEAPCRNVFSSALPMFVPSLSWQRFDF
jgi:hypothetical protein